MKSSQAVSNPPANCAALVPGRDHRVHQPRAVHVRAQPVQPRHLEHRLDLRERPHAPAAHVRRLLHRDHARARQVAVRGVADGRLHLLRREDPAVAVERVDHQLRVLRGPARLGDDRVRRAVQDQLVAARPRVQPERDLVAHRAARQEQRGLLPEQLGHALLEAVGRRVGEPLLVGHLRRRDRLPHRLGGLRLRVAVEVDHGRRRLAVNHPEAEPARLRPVLRPVRRDQHGAVAPGGAAPFAAAAR